jgi:hypothetical protein
MTQLNGFKLALIATAAALGLLAQVAASAATAEEAQKLKTVLTPLGAERAGNKDGSIPEWKGCPDLKAPLDKLKSGDRRWVPFADEKPLYVVTAANMAQYADKLSDGVKALLQKYPTMRLPVYPTHRTHCAPEWVNEATFRNATSAKLTGDAANSGVDGAVDGIPFPIPKNGLEVRWNHTLRWRGQAYETRTRHLSWTEGGAKVLGTQAVQKEQFEFYRQGLTPQKYAESGSLNYLLVQLTDAPAFRAGEALLVKDKVNPADRAAWQYLLGQRRVRRAPSVGWDTPDFVVSGTNFFDEVFGSLITNNERYEYKLIGKKEMLIPYNDNKVFALKEDELFTGKHHNPDALRWELHRVWVVEANLAPGKRHAVPRREFYIDEDTWGTSLLDGYNAAGKIWRVALYPSFYFPDMPGVMSAYGDILYVLDGTYSSRNLVMPDTTAQLKPVAMRAGSAYSPDALSGAGAN